MYVLIDCNSFYANCEKLFRPDLKHKPVVVLSNNDGCVVARSLTACHKGIVIALIDDGFTAKQLILGEHIILRAHNENYADIVVKGSLELFGVVASSIRRFKR